MLSNKLEALVSADDSVKSVNDTLLFASLAAHAAAGESTFVVRKQPPVPDFEIALAALELSVLGSRIPCVYAASRTLHSQ